ncbi:hypothetical protein [Aurantimonas coralicida]|uniref:hypothetical protein n=1 Tax=Aurantimonas coralicida TaxID=182270 RepID=UPI001E4F2679|nr:hypothetical protein [Aurantimonas coralicida]MCD1645013.1 hypothetical protein [Aurantimonas coralicida]
MGLRSGMLAAGLCGLLVANGPAEAAGGSEGALAGSLFEFALPYSPYLFDLALYAGRGVAEITYDARRYDDVTQALIVTGLKIRRDDFTAEIGQMRLSAEQAVYESVAVDTRALPLDPPVRAVLQQLDREVLTGDIVVAGRTDVAAADYDLQASVAIDGVGTLDLSADLRGFHILLPLDEFEGGAGSDDPVLAGRLQSAEASFADAGLVEALYHVVGAMQGMTADQARGTAGMMAGIGVAAVFADMPGAPDPRLQAMAREWSASVQAFLAKPDRLSLRLQPAAPFDLARLTGDAPVGAAEIVALAPSVAAGPAPAIALLDPDTLVSGPDADLAAVLTTADALIAGRGVPQDIVRAVTILLPAVEKDNRAAIGLLARALALNPRVAIPQDGLRGAYVALLLARADGIAIADDSLAAVQGRLSPEEVAAAEDDAQLRWRRTPAGEARHAAEVAAFGQRDWAAIRRLAFGYYEGIETPRNGMRAYGWATIAAAGGDRIAASLRDDLVAAVNSGRFILPMERAKAATADLWKLLIAEAPDAAGDEAAADSGEATGTDGAEMPAARPEAGQAGNEDAEEGSTGEEGTSTVPTPDTREEDAAASEPGNAVPPAD